MKLNSGISKSNTTAFITRREGGGHMTQAPDLPDQRESLSSEEKPPLTPQVIEWGHDTIFVNGKPLVILFPQSEE